MGSKEVSKEGIQVTTHLNVEVELTRKRWVRMKERKAEGYSYGNSQQATKPSWSYEMYICNYKTGKTARCTSNNTIQLSG